MEKGIVYIITVVLCILLQLGVAPCIAISGCSPDFLLIPVLFISLRSGAGVGGVMGFLLGLLDDLAGSGAVGCMSLTFCVIALIVGVIGSNLQTYTAIMSILVAVVSSFLMELVFGIATMLSSAQSSGAMSVMVGYALPSALYTAVIAIVALLTMNLVTATDTPQMPGLGSSRMPASARMPGRLKF